MRTIRISEDVWNAIAANGKFGETPDAVLRRMLKIPNSDPSEPSPENPERVLGTRKRIASRRLSAKVTMGRLKVTFEDGLNREWALPPKTDKAAVRRVTYEAMEFAEKNGATEGQILAVRKALTDAGYHLTK